MALDLHLRGYPHWGRAHMPDHDLDAGWLLHGLSLAYSWLGEDLEPERREILRAKLELQGERLHSFAEETTGRWWSSAYWQNHNWICWTGIATAGYALGRSEWTKAARANLETVLTMLPEDGSDSEGVVYWRYGVPWLAIHTDLVQRQEQADLWSTGGFLRNTTRWRLHQSAPGFEENIDHGDCHDRRSGHSVALYYRLASAYQDGTAQWLGNLVAERHFWREAYESGVRPGVMPEAFLELLWYDPRVTPAAPDREPGTAYFPDLGQITARTGWDSAATCVSFKAAPGGGHRAWDEGHRLKAAGGWDAMSAGHHHPDAGASSSTRTAPSSRWTRATATTSGQLTTTWSWSTERAGRTRAATTCTRGYPRSAGRVCVTCSPRTDSPTPRRSPRRCSPNGWVYSASTARWW